MSEYFLRSTSASQGTNTETMAKKLAMGTKARSDVGIGKTEQNVIVFIL